MIGSESLGGAKDISVKNCLFIGTDVGLRFKSLRGKGGLIENIYVDGIRMREITNEAILFDMYYSGGSPEDEATKKRSEPKAEPVSDRTPQFRNFEITHILCDGASRAVLIDGLPEMPIRNIRMSDVSIKSKTGCLIQDADSISIKNANLVFHMGPAFEVLNSTNVTLDHIVIPETTDIYMKIEGRRTMAIEALKADAGRAKKGLEVGPEVRQDAVTLK